MSFLGFIFILLVTGLLFSNKIQDVIETKYETYDRLYLKPEDYKGGYPNQFNSLKSCCGITL